MHASGGDPVAFKVEDGTGLADSNSYATDEQFDAYWTDRGTTFSGGTDAELKVLKEAALIKATDYVENRFRARFKGEPLVETQALSFPRQKLYNKQGSEIEGVPTQLVYAVCEYAKRALTTELLADAESQQIKRKKEKVGSIETEIEYTEAVNIVKYPSADHHLNDFIITSNKVMRA